MHTTRVGRGRKGCPGGALRVPRRLAVDPACKLLLDFNRNDAGGSVLRDHQRGVTCSIVGAASPWQHGPVGRYVRLNGVNEYISTPLVIDGWAEGTVVALVKTDDAGPSADIFIASDQVVGTDGAVHVQLAWSPSLSFYGGIYLTGGAAEETDFATGVASGTWYLLAFSWSGRARGREAWVDNKKREFFPIATGPTRVSPNPVLINRHQGGNGGDLSIAFFGVWSRQLEPAEHRRLAIGFIR